MLAEERQVGDNRHSLSLAKYEHLIRLRWDASVRGPLDFLDAEHATCEIASWLHQHDPHNQHPKWFQSANWRAPSNKHSMYKVSNGARVFYVQLSVEQQMNVHALRSHFESVKMA